MSSVRPAAAGAHSPPDRRDLPSKSSQSYGAVYALAVALAARDSAIHLVGKAAGGVRQLQGFEILWTAHTWLPLGLSVLCILMLRAYPRRSCVHAGLLFLTWSVVGLVAPSLTSMCRLTLSGAALAGALLVLERVLRPIEPGLALGRG